MNPNQVFLFFQHDWFLVVSGVPPGSLFEVILAPKSGSWEFLNPEKWRFGRQLEKRTEKHVKTGHASNAGNPPCGPLKEPAECRPADQAKELGDTPLVRKRTVADFRGTNTPLRQRQPVAQSL